MPTKYNFIESLGKIDLFINATIDDNVSPVIPIINEIGNMVMQKLYGTVLSIRYNLTDTVLHYETDKKNIAYSAFVSEVCSICRSNSSCRDIIILDDEIRCIYNTSLKSEVNAVIDDLARIHSLASIVEKKIGFPYKSLLVKLSACYGRLDMSVIEQPSMHLQFRWSGFAWKKAILLSEKAKDNYTLVNRVIWNNLTDDNQKLFKLLDASEEIYEGNIINLAMNNWVISK